jgi:antitoxin (DNA-binding transcriptional repressor) of toxin-antitoxin stability system
MATAARHMSVDEFADDLAGVLERVVRAGETVVIKRAGRAITVVAPIAAPKPPRRRRATTEVEQRAFLASAGSWQGLVDDEEFLAANARSRRVSTRPAVEL